MNKINQLRHWWKTSPVVFFLVLLIGFVISVALGVLVFALECIANASDNDYERDQREKEDERIAERNDPYSGINYHSGKIW
jgi:hypothetical protein